MLKLASANTSFSDYTSIKLYLLPININKLRCAILATTLVHKLKVNKAHLTSYQLLITNDVAHFNFNDNVNGMTKKILINSAPGTT